MQVWTATWHYERREILNYASPCLTPVRPCDTEEFSSDIFLIGLGLVAVILTLISWQSFQGLSMLWDLRIENVSSYYIANTVYSPGAWRSTLSLDRIVRWLNDPRTTCLFLYSTGTFPPHPKDEFEIISATATSWGSPRVHRIIRIPSVLL